MSGRSSKVRFLHYPQKKLSMKSDIIVEQFGDRFICIKGVGKLFYQDGFPISMAVSILKERGVEVSIFHVADECMKNGWSAKTTINKLRADFEDDIDKNKFDLNVLITFCNSEYEDQREMILNYLFKSELEKQNFIRNFVQQ